MNKLNVSVLNSFPAVDEQVLDELLTKEISENPMKIVETKKTIARMLTVLREKQLAENA